MRYEVLEQFFGKAVEVMVSKGTVNGVMIPSEMDGGFNDTVEVEPILEHHIKRYGNWVLNVEMIQGIRPIKPHVDEDDGDDCEKDSGP